MNVEMEALKKNKTWKMVHLLAGKRSMGCKWVYTVKYRAIGILERYKARLVAKGYTLTYNVDYLDIYFDFQDEHNHNFVIIGNKL